MKAIVFGLFVILPLGWSAWTFRGRAATRLDAVSSKLLLAEYVALIALIGPWWSWGYPLLGLVIAAGAAAMLAPVRLHEHVPHGTAARWARGLGRAATLAVGILFGSSLVEALRGWMPPSNAHDLAWPFAPGVYAAGQGGASELLNYHYPHPQQRYAFDLVRAPLFAIRLTPAARLSDYSSFGVEVLSPCDGRVVAVEASLPDQIPPASDTTKPPGNHITIACAGGPHVMLAHLARRSLNVSSGSLVKARQPIAKVGNSGNTSEPHLHLHAWDPATSEPRAITFAGRFPARNQLAKIR